MSNPNGAVSHANAYDPKTLARKHRISIEDAEKVIAEYGNDLKGCDKAARRIAL